VVRNKSAAAPGEKEPKKNKSRKGLGLIKTKNVLIVPSSPKDQLKSAASVKDTPSAVTKSNHTTPVASSDVQLQQPAMSFSAEKLPVKQASSSSRQRHTPPTQKLRREMDAVVSRLLFEKEKSSRSSDSGKCKSRTVSAPVTTRDECILSLDVPLSTREQAEVSEAVYPEITRDLQERVRSWVTSLGLSVLEGEGGFTYYLVSGSKSGADSSRTGLFGVSSSGTSPRSLLDDKLRNGVMLADLALLLEPAASSHLKLQVKLRRNPVNLKEVSTNVQVALWVFRLRVCPPVPLAYLCQPREIIRGNMSVLWGLFDALMQLYHPKNHPSSGSFISTVHVTQSPIFAVEGTRELPYTREQIAALSTSLAQVFIN
jgi:hypothetical protein